MNSEEMNMNGMMMPPQSPFSPVEGHNHLFRDERTTAIINTDMDAYENYKKSKKIEEAEVERIDNLEDDLKSLKDDLGEIKSLLRSIANGT